MSESKKANARISTSVTILLFAAFLLSGAVSGIFVWSYGNTSPQVEKTSAPAASSQPSEAPSTGTAEREVISRRFDSLELPAGIKLVMIAKDQLEGVDEFFITETEITNAQYEHFSNASDRVRSETDAADKPVVLVSYNQAQAFCNRLGSAVGLAGRLPREVEWEYAATGLNESASGFSNPLRHSLPVGQIPAVRSDPQNVSQFGVFDLPGSVWEWTSDEPSPAEAKLVDRGSLGPDKLRIVKGGSANEPPKSISPKQREIVPLLTKDRALGFRCVAAKPGRSSN